MTAPWLRRRSKTDELEATVALLAIGIHFVVGTTLAFVVGSSSDWLLHCYLVACGSVGGNIAIRGFVILDVLLFLVACGWSFVLSSNGWWRVVPPVAGMAITGIAAVAALSWVALAA